MKNLLKIAGIIAVVAILVCNLEYPMFSGNMKSTPNKAFADWYNIAGSHYCGSSPDTTLHTGTWTYDNQNLVYSNYDYKPTWADSTHVDIGFYLFDPYDQNGTDCGPNIGYQCCGDSDPYHGNISYVTNPYPYPFYTTGGHGYIGYGPY